ncbi:MAG: Hpt domain-containing protein, partial [Campylobacterales bacterium]
NSQDSDDKSNPITQQGIVLDKEFLIDNLDGDMESIKNMYTMFLKTLDDSYSTIIDDIRYNNNAQAQIHSLKGSSGTIGAKKLSDICTELNTLLKEGKPIDKTIIDELAKIIELTKDALRGEIDSKE